MVVPHGFRSSFRDWAAEETDHPREVVESAPAHAVRNSVEATDARSDLFERVRLPRDDWAAYLAGERGRSLCTVDGPWGWHPGCRRAMVAVLVPVRPASAEADSTNLPP